MATILITSNQCIINAIDTLKSLAMGYEETYIPSNETSLYAIDNNTVSYNPREYSNMFDDSNVQDRESIHGMTEDTEIPNEFDGVPVVYLCRLYCLINNRYRYVIGYSDDSLEDLYDGFNDLFGSSDNFKILIMIKNITPSVEIVIKHALYEQDCDIEDNSYIINCRIYDIMVELSTYTSVRYCDVTSNDIYVDIGYYINEKNQEFYDGSMVTECEPCQ